MLRAQAFGAKFAMCAWIPHQGDFTEADVHRAAADFNEWGAAFKAAGITFAYYFVEDESAAPLESVPQSVKYVQRLRY